MYSDIRSYKLGVPLTVSHGEWKQPHSVDLCYCKTFLQAAGETLIMMYHTPVSLIYNQCIELLR